MRKQTENTCYGCEDRHIGCHSSCEKYKAYKQEIEDKKNKIRQEAENHSDWWSHKMDQIEKVKKRKRDKKR